MTKAKVVGYVESIYQGGMAGNHIKDPMNKTLHMSIRKAQRRRERYEKQQKSKIFNPIRGWEKLEA